MHINAKRMKRRIEKPQPVKFYGSPNLTADVINDPAEPPLYTFISDYKDRAALLGITITETAGDSGAASYTISGGCMKELNEPPATYNSIEELAAAIGDLWEIETEPEAEYYTDDTGRLHQRIIYPELKY